MVLHDLKLHPLPLFIYFVLVLILTMGMTSPIMITVSMVIVSIYEIVLVGKKAWWKKMKGLLWLLLFVSLGNMLFSHRGLTILFYLNDNAITLEAFYYGLFMGGMLMTAILWFDLFQLLCDSEKLRFLFGKTMPSLGLIISMTLHFIPMLQKRLAVIRQAQRGMGRGNDDGLIARIKQTGKEYSILISWSLENAIETSDAMTARGYGNRRRSCFHTYVFHVRDGIFLAIAIGLFVIAAIGTFRLGYRVFYYPSIIFPQVDMGLVVCYIGYLLYLCLPMVLEMRRVRR